MRSGLAVPFIALCDLLFTVLNIVVVQVAPKALKAEGPKQPALYFVTEAWSADVDADVDAWLQDASGRLISYSTRQVGCITLDTDNRGFEDSVITLADGSKSKVSESKETIALRCLIPGTYTIAAHLYNFRENGIAVGYSRHDLGVKVRAEIVNLNPYGIAFAKDIVLNSKWECQNLTSFTLAPDGKITLEEAPLTCIVDKAYIRNAQP